MAAEFLAVIFQTDIAQYHYSIARLDGIDDCDIFPYIPVSLQTFLSLKDWGRTEVYLCSNGSLSDFGVDIICKIEGCCTFLQFFGLSGRSEYIYL